MNAIREKRPGSVLNAGRHILLTAGAVCLIGGAALAQDSGTTGDQGYKVGEKSQQAQTDSSAQADKQAPVETKRLARFDYVKGNVTWRPDDNAKWKKASSNQALHEGGQIWVADGGRAEIRFDDGSLLRLGNNSIVTVQTLYGDTEGNYTELKMTSGVITLRPRLEKSVFQVDTPFNNVKTSGPSRVRVGVDNSVEVGVRRGKATVEGKPGKTVVKAGSYMIARDANAPYDFQSLPAEDSWERWNDERDRMLYPGYPRPAYGPAPFYFGFGFGVPVGPVYRPYWGHGGWHRW